MYCIYCLPHAIDPVSTSAVRFQYQYGAVDELHIPFSPLGHRMGTNQNPILSQESGKMVGGRNYSGKAGTDLRGGANRIRGRVYGI